VSLNPCPACNAEIPLADINIPEGVGLCRACGKLSRLADIADASDSADLASQPGPPPAGCRIDDDGAGITVRASCRSLSGAAGALFICLFWNGIVSIFVLLAFAGLYTNLVGPLPHWFPAPGNGKHNSGIPLGMCIFLCIFLIPFVTIGLVIFAGLLTCIAGETRVIISGATAAARTGIGPFGWTKRFDATAVKRISICQTTWKQNDQSRPLIHIEADRPIKFGSALTEERRNWMIAALRTLLIDPKHKRGP
jgi:hypothetical protein